jgi:hypothetical protein
MDISIQIIEAIKTSAGYKDSDKDYTITIEGLCEMMPGTSRHLIIGALVDMAGVRVIDSVDGTIDFPSSYFR